MRLARQNSESLQGSNEGAYGGPGFRIDDRAARRQGRGQSYFPARPENHHCFGSLIEQCRPLDRLDEVPVARDPRAPSRPLTRVP